MYIFLAILTILTSIVLVLVVLVQNSKGGGLSSNFSSSNQIMGAPKTADFLEKLTWGLACTIIVLSLASAKLVHNANQVPQAPITAPVDNTAAPDVQSPLPMPAEGEVPSLPAPTE
jgi:preprotein translocase subunit SecG